MAPLLPLLTVDPSDCAFAEADYLDLRRVLLAERRAGPFAVRADSPRCQRALRDVLRNASLLRVYPEAEETCTLVLRSGPEGWALDPEGPCGEEERLEHIKRKILTTARPPLPDLGYELVVGSLWPPTGCR